MRPEAELQNGNTRYTAARTRSRVRPEACAAAGAYGAKRFCAGFDPVPQKRARFPDLSRQRALLSGFL